MRSEGYARSPSWYDSRPGTSVARGESSTGGGAGPGGTGARRRIGGDTGCGARRTCGPSLGSRVSNRQTASPSGLYATGRSTASSATTSTASPGVDSWSGRRRGWPPATRKSDLLDDLNRGCRAARLCSQSPSETTISFLWPAATNASPSVGATAWTCIGIFSWRGSFLASRSKNIRKPSLAPPAASSQSPSGMEGQVLDQPLELVAGELVRPLALPPVEDLDAGLAFEVVDVADLADPADGQQVAVGREGQRRGCRRSSAGAAVGSQVYIIGASSVASRLPGGDLPDDDVADLVAGRQVPAVGREGAGVEHRGEVVRRRLGVAAQFADAARPSRRPRAGRPCRRRRWRRSCRRARRRRRGSTSRGPRPTRTFEPRSRSHQISRPS